MKIRLKMTLPIDKKHGMVKDRVLEVVRELSDPKRGAGGSFVKWEVMGDAKELVGVLKREAEVVDEKVTA